MQIMNVEIAARITECSGLTRFQQRSVHPAGPSCAIAATLGRMFSPAWAWQEFSLPVMTVLTGLQPEIRALSTATRSEPCRQSRLVGRSTGTAGKRD
jgi:hypothetical protein